LSAAALATRPTWRRLGLRSQLRRKPRRSTLQPWCECAPCELQLTALDGPGSDVGVRVANGSCCPPRLIRSTSRAISDAHLRALFQVGPVRAPIGFACMV